MAIRKTAKRWLSCCGVCGVISLVLGGCLWLILAPIMVDVIIQLNFLVQEENSPLYQTFVYTWSGDPTYVDDEVPAYEEFWIYNFTNAEEALWQGAKPDFYEFGPFMYRVNLTRLDVEFRDTGSGHYVRFYRMKEYYFQPDMSACNDNETYLTNLNPAYLAAVATAANQERLINVALSAKAAGDGMNTTALKYVGGLDEKRYEDARNWCFEQDPSCETYYNSLEDDRDMALAMFQWGFFYRDGRDRFNGLLNEKLSDVDPETWPEAFELWSNQLSSPAISVEKTWKTFFNETVGLYNFPELVEHFALLSLSDDPAAEAELLATWGVNHDEGTAITRYLLSMASSSYTLSIVQGALNAGGGLITTHTAREWLFGFYDPLLELLSPADAYVYSFYNATSEDDARAHEGRWEFDTGKYDIIEVNNMTLYDGKTTFDWFTTPVEIEGNSGTGQFPFYKVNGRGQTMDILPDVLVWSPDHGRAIVFKDTGEKEYQLGVRTHIFEVANETYTANPRYDIRPGFEGFINSTRWNDQSPLYYCPPHFYLVQDEGWYNNVTYSFVLPASRVNDSTFIWIEPITGLALQGIASLQVNAYIESNTVYDTNYPNNTLQSNTMYPYLWTKQTTALTEPLAQMLEDDLFSLLDIAFITWYTLMALGAAILIAVAIFFVRERRIVATTGYRAIND